MFRHWQCTHIALDYKVTFTLFYSSLPAAAQFQILDSQLWYARYSSACYRFRSDCLYYLVPTSAGAPTPLLPSPFFFFLSRTEEPVPVTGVRYNSLLWPDLTWCPLFVITCDIAYLDVWNINCHKYTKHFYLHVNGKSLTFLFTNSTLYVCVYMYVCMYVLMYDYIYVLFVCRVWLYIHRYKPTGTGD